MTAIIIDDELQSHEVLRQLLAKDHSDIQVLASGYNVAQGLELVRELQPELVFLDIEMPDGTGFDLLRQVGQPDFQVIFITAHNDHAVTAIHFGVLDYLLKPPQPAELARALEKARAKKAEQDDLERWKMALETYQQLQAQQLPSRMIVSTLEGMHFIPIDDIVYLEAAANCTEIKYRGANKRLIASVNLGEYEEQFKPYRYFMRVHRSYLVNLKMVKTFVKGEGHLLMGDGSPIRVARTNQEDVLRRLGEL